MGEKTEKATPKKLKDARKKGQVAKSQDFPSVFTFVTSVSLLLGLSATIYGNLTSFITLAFTSVARPDLDVFLGVLYGRALYTILITSLPIMVLTAMVGVLISFLMVGPGLSMEAFKPDIKKFNPISNLKGKFKMKTLVELIKSMLKISIAGYVIYGIMYSSLPVLTTAVSNPPGDSIWILYYFLIEVITKISLIFIVIAVADLLYQKQQFAKEMKMEKFEIKQEHKNSEGDPQVKGKRKEIAREIAYSSGPAQTVKMAKAIVTNPTHLAIAIGYDQDEDPAPYILEMGEGQFANLLVKIAEQYDIPVMRNIPLAHALYEEGQVWAYVPEDTYEALAEIMRWLLSLEEDNETAEAEWT
jgi:type III secretion protein U